MDATKLDAKLERLAKASDRWARLNLDVKIDMLDRFVDRLASLAERYVDENASAKGLRRASAETGEEWFSGPVPVMRYARFLRKTLVSIAERGRPPVERDQIRRRDDGQVVVDVLPLDAWDRALFPGFEASVWMEPEVRAADIYEETAAFYRQSDPDGCLNLVLTVGNVSSIPPLDVLSKLYVEGHVCLTQLHPVLDYMQSSLEELFAEFIEEGFVDVVFGRSDVGAYLCGHDLVDEIHLTGSDATHDAIVDGFRAEEEDVKITSALGNISPVIVAPGPWSDDDITFHAENIATQIVANAGFNCNDAQVLITPEGWDRRDDLLDGIRNLLEEIPIRTAFYHGAHERFERFMGTYDQSEQFGTKTDDLLPWGLIPDVDPSERESLCFTEETFCGVLCETAIEAPDVGYYLAKAVDFCNDHLWGTLCSSLIVHPDIAQPHQGAVEAAISDLEYGTVTLNHWPAMAYGLGVTPWGSYPGNTYDDIQSGIGWTHNAFMFDRPQKSVMRGPFRTRIRPPWFATNRRAHKLGPRLLQLERRPSVGQLLQVLWQEVRG